MDEQSQLRHALTDRDPGDESAIADQPPAIESLLDEEDLAVIALDEAPSIRSLTPSGLELFYSWEPRRHYKIRRHTQDVQIEGAHWEPLATDWFEVPSVTTVLSVLDKSGALSWWAQGQAAAGILELYRRGVLVGNEGVFVPRITDASGNAVDEADIVKFLVEQKLSINHVKNKAADRGTNVHTVLETWAIDQSFRANPELYEEHEKGYIVGLNQFFEDISGVGAVDVETEVMVGSLEHGFAGRYDVRLAFCSDLQVVTRVYPKRKDRLEIIDAGNYLLDLKTSKSVYDTHALQLAAYELASIECGYGPTDYRAVIHVTQDGKYEFVRTHANPEDFLSVLACHQTMSNTKGWLS